MQQGYQDRLEHLLLDGDLDLLLGRPPEDKSLAHRRLFVEQQGVLLRADDQLAGKGSIPLRELGGLRLILLRGNPHFGQNFLELSAKHDLQLTALHAAEDFPSTHWRVRAGVGVAPCSLLLADALPGGLVAKPIRPELPKLEIHALWRGRVPPPPAARWLKMIGEPFA